MFYNLLFTGVVWCLVCVLILFTFIVWFCVLRVSYLVVLLSLLVFVRLFSGV